MRKANIKVSEVIPAVTKSLNDYQLALEKATKSFKAAQQAFLAAKECLASAKKTHATSSKEFQNEVQRALEASQVAALELT